MGDYTHLEFHEAQSLLKQYSLGDKKLSKLEPLSLGISNSNYKLEFSNGCRLLLKVSNDKKIEDLEGEQNILYFLRNRFYPYSVTPLQTLWGKGIYQFKSLHGALYPFIEGIPPGPNDATCYQIGQALAKLHSLSVEKEDRESNHLRFYREVGFDACFIKNYVDQGLAPKTFEDKFYDIFPDALEKYLSQNFKKGIIHGDLYYDNTLFYGEELAALLDFEQSGIGDCLLDLGISLSGTCLEKGMISSKLIHSYLLGYESVRALEKNEKRFLKQSIQIGLFSISLWRIKRFKEGDLNPALKESFLELLTKAQALKEISL